MKKKFIKKSLLIKLYTKQKYSIGRIAKKLHCSNLTIWLRLQEYNIVIRTISQSLLGKKQKRQTIKKRVLSRKGYKHSKVVKSQIAQSLIGHRVSPETLKKLSLVLGGTGIPYEFAKYPAEFRAIRKSIRERDNFQCQMSNMTEKEHLKKYGRVLDVHHIDYDKENCKENNLITLTDSWNKKVNYNRKYWTKHFQNKLKN